MVIAQRILAAFGAIGVAALAVFVVARVLFNRRIGGEIDALLAEARPAQTVTVADRDLDGLPEPVQRWLRYSRVVGTRRPATVRLTQVGEFRLADRTWAPFAAEQYFTTDPPGFLWKATFRMAPFVSVTGRDRYQRGEGNIEMRLLSLVPVARRQGGGLNQGAMLRYLGEIQWFPAIALSPYISWEAIDASSARATMADGGVTASMTWTFAADGRLLEVRAMRYNDARRRNELWVNRNDSERDFSGVRVPSSGEAWWEYESGPYPYIRWRIEDVQNDPLGMRHLRGE